MKALIVHQSSLSILEQFPELASIVSSATSAGGGEAIPKSKLMTKHVRTFASVSLEVSVRQLY